MPIFFTPQGFQKIKRKLNFLKNIGVKKIIKKLQEATRLKDKETYIVVKEEQSLLQLEIKKLEDQIRNAEVVTKEKSSQVQVGSAVLVNCNNEEKTFHIVGPALVDPATNKISYQSPLGNALLGKSIGDTVEVETESGKIKCKIIKIS